MGKGLVMGASDRDYIGRLEGQAPDVADAAHWLSVYDELIGTLEPLVRDLGDANLSSRLDALRRRRAQWADRVLQLGREPGNA